MQDIRHIGLIPDGNRRYGVEKYGESQRGYDDSAAAMKKTIEWCLSQDISYLSIFVFSIENFKRPPAEKSYLFHLLETALKRLLDEFENPGRLAISFLSCYGYREKLPKSLVALLQCLETKFKTTNETKLCVSFLIGYGGKQEILDATKGRGLCTGHLPPLDIVVRTGKAMRLSNFMLLKSAYAELFFPDIFFPEMTPSVLDSVKSSFLKRKRTYGK